jgi:c-di-GMP-binding flagellar brake protein YcgR
MGNSEQDRRKYFRNQVEFCVVNFESDLPDMSVRYNGTIKDISEGGLGITTTTFIPKEHSILFLDFKLPDTGYELIDIKSIVRWVQDDKFGVEFLELTQEDREKLKEYLSKNKG